MKKALNSLCEYLININNSQPKENEQTKPINEKTNDDNAFYNSESFIEALEVLEQAFIDTKEKMQNQENKKESLHFLWV